MINVNLKTAVIELSISKSLIDKFKKFINDNGVYLLIIFLWTISIVCFLYFYQNGLGLAYNDARSHLNIARRVVEGLKPGLAQLGSVWLPLPHILMVPTIWSDLMWHSGLSGGLISMISFVGTGLIIYKFLEKIGVGLTGRFTGLFIFISNLNILYLQSTAMTELLLIFTMSMSTYEFLIWHKENRLNSLIRASFWTMMASLVRYDGWFLLIFGALLVGIQSYKKWGLKNIEGALFFYLTLSAFGIFLWFLWNLLIFGDPLYFVFGPYSAHTQQEQLQASGNLATKGNFIFSLQIYFYALIYNTGLFTTMLGIIGAIAFYTNKTIKNSIKIASLVLFSSFLFNVLALFMGHSVLFIQGLSGNTWFNVRYGIVVLPSIAIFSGYLIDRFKPVRLVIIGLMLFVTFFSIANSDAVTIDDAKFGSSQKNVSEVSSWLVKYASAKPGFILISAASHDAIIFSSGLPMKKFIHEGTGAYWTSATKSPDRWARWIIMRTNDNNDRTFKFVNESGQIDKYKLMQNFPFADVYELKEEYLANLNTTASLGKQK